MSVSRIQVPLSAMASGASFAGTCFTQTTMFNDSSREPKGRQKNSRAAPVSTRFPAFEQQRSICSAKAERVRKRVAHLGLSRVVRNVVEIARRVRVFVIDGRR